MADIEGLINELADNIESALAVDSDYVDCVRTDTLQTVVGLLKEQNWVKCSDRMPEEHDSIFAKLKGTDKWQSSMFEKSSDDVRIVEVFGDGTRRVYHSHTIDGKWDIENRPIKRTVTHWMPNPELPLEGW